MTQTVLAPVRSRRDLPERTRRPRRRSRSFAILGLLPFVLFSIVFAVYPLAQVVRMAGSAVAIRSGRLDWQWTGTDNLRRILADPATSQVLLNTLVFVVATVVLSLVLGLVLAVLVDRAVVLLPVARNVLIWPAVIAPVVVSLIWLLMLSPTAGGLNKVLRTLSLPEQGWLGSGPSAMVSVIAVDVWHWTPVVFLFLYTALKGVDHSTLEAARVDGANEREVLRHVVLPALKPAIGAVVVVRVIMGIKAFDEMYLLTRGGPDGATTLVSHHIKTLFFDNLQLGEAAAFSILTVVLTAMAAGVVLFIRERSAR